MRGEAVRREIATSLGILLLFVSANLPADQSTQYDGWQRTSVYVAVRDGTRLALDYYRPTQSGTLHTAPLPVIWRFSPYGRYPNDPELGPNELPERSAGTINGKRVFETYLKNGYIVAEADVRGTGASFGVSRFMLSSQEGRDSADLTEWLAGRSFTTGKVGMVGLSYLGSLLFQTMAERPESLRAVFSQHGTVDVYDAYYHNGIARMALPFAWRQVRASLDHGQVAPVDGDADRSLLGKAVAEHYWNVDPGAQVAVMPFYDSPDPVSGLHYWTDANAWNRLRDIEQSNVAIYHFTGWFDTAAQNHLKIFANLNNPQKLHVGPYYHLDAFGVDIAQESLRWFDYWLKGIDNGLMTEPPVRYFVTGDDPADGWRTSEQWPPGEEQRQAMHLHKGRSGSVDSINDGLMSFEEPSEGGADGYRIDYDITLGSYLDRNNGLVSPLRAESCPRKIAVPDECYAHSGYADLSTRYDAKALTYTSTPLAKDIVITGHPAVRLWVSSDLADFDIYATLEEVEKDGTSRLVSDNAIRASHRRQGDAPFDNLGLPWQSNLADDALPVPENEPVEIALELAPVANRFDSGNRIRLTIAAADADANPPPELKLPGSISIHRGPRYPSLLELPVVPQ